MSQYVDISIPTHSVENGWPSLSATIDVPGHRHEVFYRASRGPIDDGGVFLAAGLLPAMKLGLPLRLPQQPPDYVLERISTYQEIMHLWYPELHKIRIVGAAAAPAAVEGSSIAHRPAAVFFSAGVDSFYVTLKHQRTIDCLIFVHGFDVALPNSELREKAVAGVRGAANDLGLPLIEVETNVASMLHDYASWQDHSHGAALASVALLLSPQLRRVYIASTDHYSRLRPLGSHPLLDPLWSSDETEIVHDGVIGRQGKIESICRNDIAMRWLRVCWENKDNAYNCGRCDKCINTMIRLHLAGALERCATLPHKLDYDVIACLPVRRRGRIGVQALLRDATLANADPALQQALRERLRRSGYGFSLDEPGEDSKRLQVLLSSRSWQLTAPLRTLGQRARRLRSPAVH